MTAVITLAGLGLGCWVLRAMFIVLVPARLLPERFRAGLAFLAPAMLAAMVAVQADVTSRDGGATTAALVLGSLFMVGAAVRCTGSPVVGMAVGCAALLLLDLVVG